MSVAAAVTFDATEVMAKFWQEHVCTYKVKHGTSSIYESHFRKEGISSNYPAALKDLIQKIIKLYHDHPVDASGYFSMFENRFNAAIKDKKIEMSFSASPSVIDEFTRGPRRGGEWIRELRRFALYMEKEEGKLSADEKVTLMKVRELIYLMDKLPPMTVAINAGCADPYVRLCQFRFPFFGPFIDFQKYVKASCPEYQNPDKLLPFLNKDLFESINKIKKAVASGYEEGVFYPVKPEDLEIEVLHEEKKVNQPPSSVPQIEFDKPTLISSDDITKMNIGFDGISSLKQYAESTFECVYQDKDYLVTRMHRPEEYKQKMEHREQKVQFRKELLTQLGCESLIERYGPVIFNT